MDVLLLSKSKICVEVQDLGFVLYYFLGSGKKGEAGGEMEEDGSYCCPSGWQER